MVVDPDSCTMVYPADDASITDANMNDASIPIEKKNSFTKDKEKPDSSIGIHAESREMGEEKKKKRVSARESRGVSSVNSRRSSGGGSPASGRKSRRTSAMQERTLTQTHSRTISAFRKAGNQRRSIFGTVPQSTTEALTDEQKDDLRKAKAPETNRMMRNLSVLSLPVEEILSMKSEADQQGKGRSSVRQVQVHMLKTVCVALFCVGIFVLGRNAISSPNCIRLPSLIYFPLWEFFWLGWIGSIGTCVSFIELNFRKEVRFGTRKMLLVACGSLFFPLILAPLYGLNSDRTPPQGVRLRIVGAILHVVIVYFILRRNAAKNDGPPGVESEGFKKLSYQLAGLGFRMFFLFFGGFYVAMTFTIEYFPLIKTTLEKRLCSIENLGQPTCAIKCNPYKDYVIAFVEGGIATCFFSIALPFWTQAVCAQMVYVVQRYPSGASMILRPEPAVLDRMMIITNWAMDITRFIYGRGLLFKLSSLIMFFVMLFKDSLYQLWHFGFKYTTWVLIFTIKIFHRNGRELKDLENSWYMTIAKIVERCVKFFGISKALARCWEPVCDFALLEYDRQQREMIGAKHLEEEKNQATLSEQLLRLSTDSATSVGLRINFANVSIRVINLPEKFRTIIEAQAVDEDYVEAMSEESADEMNEDMRRELADTIAEEDAKAEALRAAANTLNKLDSPSDASPPTVAQPTTLLTDPHPEVEGNHKSDEKEGKSQKDGEKCDKDEKEAPSRRSSDESVTADLDQAKTSAALFRFSDSLSSNDCRSHSAETGSNQLDNKCGSLDNSKASLPQVSAVVGDDLEDPIVTDEEAENLGMVIAFIQTQVYIRYTCRCWVKLFTSLCFFLMPLITRLGKGWMSPGYIDPTTTSKAGTQQWIAGIAFLCVDLAEMTIINRIMRGQEYLYDITTANVVETKAAYFIHLVNKDWKMAYGLFAWLGFMGCYLYHVAWSPFKDLETLNYPDGRTSIEQLFDYPCDDTEMDFQTYFDTQTKPFVDWDQVKYYCYEQADTWNPAWGTPAWHQ